MELNKENIFNELQKTYAAIPDNILLKTLCLLCNKKTYHIYKIAYALNFGYSLPDNLNYMGIKIIIDDSVNDNFIYIIPKEN